MSVGDRHSLLVVAGQLSLSISNNDSSTRSLPDTEFVVSNELQRLLDRWESMTAAGEEVTAEQLCEGDLGLAEQLRDYVNWLEMSSGSGHPSSLPPPESIGPYKILSEISRGPYSIVYLAEQRFPSRKVALKLLHDLAARPRVKSRFQLEVELLGTLQHPNIAKIFDAGVADVLGASRLYFTMEWVEGADIGQYIRFRRQESDWSPSDTIRLCLHFCEALSAAHDEGIVHRDLKPANMLVTDDGVPKLIDFGLARIRRDNVDDPRHEPTTEAWIGTRSYMSPEQFNAQAGQIDVRTDVYGMAVVLYQLLSGRLPYEIDNKSMWETAQIVKSQPPLPIGRVDRRLRGDLELILETALAKDPAERYGAMEAFATDLKNYLDGKPILARRQGAGRALWKWSLRHRRVAAVSVIAIVLLMTLAVTAGITAKLANDRSQELRKTNQILRSNEAELVFAKEESERSARRLRRTAMNQALLRLGLIARREPDHVAEQLADETFCPPGLRGYVWNLLYGYTTQVTTGWNADRRGLLDVAISDDGSWLVTSGPSGVRAWETVSGKPLAAIEGQIDSPTVRLALDGDSRAALFARRDGTAVRFDIASHQTQLLWSDDAARATAVAAVTGDQGYLIGDQSGRLTHFDRPGGRQTWQRQLDDSAIIGLTIAAQGDRVGTVSQNGVLTICDLQTGDPLERQRASFVANDAQSVFRGRYSDDLRLACLCRQVKAAGIWDLASNQSLRTWGGQIFLPDLEVCQSGAGLQGQRILLSGRGQVVLLGGDGKLATIYRSDRANPLGIAPNQTTATPTASTPNVDGHPFVVDASRQGGNVAIGLRGGRVLIASVTPKRLYQSWKPLGQVVRRLAFSSRGDLLATYSPNGIIGIYETQTGELQRQWSTGTKNIYQILFAGPDPILITRQRGRDVNLWDATNGHQIDSPNVPGGTRGIMLDGDRLLIGLDDDQPRWLPLEDSEGTLRLAHSELHVDSGIAIAAKDPLTGLLATADDDDTVVLWRESKNGQVQRLGERHLDNVKTMKFHPGGSALVTGTLDGMITVWSMPDFEVITRRQSPAQLAEIDFSVDGGVMASGHFDGEVLFWDTRVWQTQLVVQTDIVPIRDLQFAPHSNQLAVAGKGDHIAVFSAPDQDGRGRAQRRRATVRMAEN
ncbi:WD40 repeat domain-containing serine/threonine-protein kinase [Stieleria mannarensis]|uniref:WD40 repeat domain-containing serine/threonine-protein kinase n=1 Tax=Stieleria mannarensis TaxID=2755585 RepID=UPI0016033F9C|nr:WD40 repeat domain-containing serine/threonine-protein kinase [Rhodopirellula sp. JC639]